LLDKENGNPKGSTKMKVATERVQMGRSRDKKRKDNSNRGEIGVKEKRHEKGEEKGCTERKVQIGNK
jgi:hypothetical protein